MIESSRGQYMRMDIQNHPRFVEQFSNRNRELFYHWTYDSLTYTRLGQMYGVQPHYVSQILRRMKAAYDEIQEEWT